MAILKFTYSGFGDDWIFEFDYDALCGFLTGPVVDWAVFQVVNGTVSDVPLYDEEKRWLKSVWKDAVGPLPKHIRKLTSKTASEGRPFTEHDVRDIFANPMYAGIGPFDTVIDGEPVTIPEIPKIFDDEDWIKIQERRIEDDGPRRALLQMRGTLYKYLGVKVATIFNEGWLESSIRILAIEGTETFFKRLLNDLRPNSKSPLQFAQTQVRFSDITPSLLTLLQKKPDEIFQLSPETFEQLICERLDNMNYNVNKVGGHSYRKDGGVDIIAWPKASSFPFLIAVQAKHHRGPKVKTGVQAVRDLHSVVKAHSFNIGVLVTNTTFTPDAQWFAQHERNLLQLKDIEDIREWLENRFLRKYELRDMVDEIELAPGVKISIPRFK